MASQSLSQSLSRRLVVLDIETVSLNPNNPDGALDAKNGRIACIGLLIDDNTTLQPKVICDQDEKKILEQFWATIAENDLLVGHNVLGFDLLFIRQRSWILGVRPPGEKPNSFLNLRKYYTEQVYDLMEIWTNWSNRFKGCGLGDIAEALGVGAKTGHGSDVAQLWANREYVKLMDYCMNDVWLSYQVYCRMQYREPLGVPLPAFTAPARELAMVPAIRRAETVERSPRRLPLPHSQPAAAAAIAPAPAPERSSRRRREGREGNREIIYRAAGGSLVLTGATYTVRDTLKKVLGARGRKDESGSFEWELSVDKFDALAGLCAKTGIRLVAAA